MGCGASEPENDIETYHRPQVFFVLGGPGCGKGTQCENMVRDYKFKHLSAGDLLREEQAKGGADAQQIQKCIKDGILVKSEMIVKLLKKAMAFHGNRRYLIDGFPRNKENLDQFNKILASEVDVKTLIFFECSEKVMIDRITERGKTSGRADDNPETIKKRLVTFNTETLPVVQEFELQGKCIKVNAEAAKETVYEHLKEALTKSRFYKPVPPEVYFVVGGPGSGKGTQCENLVRDYGFKHLSTGDLLRDAQSSGSKDGAQIAALMKEGKLVSSDLLINLIRANMEKNNFQGKYLIDGLPRNQENVDMWDKMMGWEVNVKSLIYFKCSEEVMEKRLLERAKTSGRVDDNAETIKKRFKTFTTETEPVIKSYHERGQVIEVSAEDTPDKVYANLQKALSDKGVEPRHHDPNGASVVFVLGGPGSGKGTQCENMVRDFGFGHLSTGDLLREEETHKGINSDLIQDYMKAGKLVPSEILVRLVKKAIKNGGNKVYLLDGFPRSEENIRAWQEEIGADVQIRNMVYFECSQQVMEERLLGRAKTSGRADDNPETIKKRFQTFVSLTEPILRKYQKQGQGFVLKVSAEKGKEEVYADLKQKLVSAGYKTK